jgi:hypothetical protein
MSKLRQQRGTAALVVAIVALVAAIGGVAAAAPSPKAHAASKRGPRGHRGPRGPQGPAGSFSAANVADVSGPTGFMGPFGASSAVAGSLVICPGSGVALGGGPEGITGDAPISATIAYDNPLNGGAWEVIMVNDDDSSGASFHTVATCASSGGVARDVQSTRQIRQRFERDLAAAKAKH